MMNLGTARSMANEHTTDERDGWIPDRALGADR
jgi:hypothetical protein